MGGPPLEDRCLMLVDDTNHTILVLPGYDTNRMWKCNTRTGQRIEIDIKYSEPSAFWKLYLDGPEDDMMCILNDTDNGSIRFFQPKRFQRKTRISSDDIMRLYVIGDVVYQFQSEDSSIRMMKKETGKPLNRRHLIGPLSSMQCCEYSRHSNSIFTHNRNRRQWYTQHGPSSDFEEFCVSTNQLITRQWMRSLSLLNPLMMQCTMDKRYIVVIDGSNGAHRYPEGIVVFDLKTQNSLRFSGTFEEDIDGAVMMNNFSVKKELLTFAFVKCSWNEAGYQNLPPMPCYLIEMISKWFCNEEQVYLMTACRQLHSIRVSDIIRCYHHPEESPQNLMELCHYMEVPQSAGNMRETITIDCPME